MRQNQHGVTLVELMITIAVLAVLAGIAVPLYQGYIQESHVTAMRSEMAKLRVPIEDFRLEYGAYNFAGPPTLATYIQPMIDELEETGSYEYALENPTATSYDLLGTSTGAAWVRCCNRFQSCLDSESTGSSTPAACP
jgi:type IV pilus assembly protein PilE